jgi:hypothetical protein
VDGAGLTDAVLRVLPVCPEAVQKQLIGFLPEVAQEGEHEVSRWKLCGSCSLAAPPPGSPPTAAQRVLDALQSLLESDLSFMSAVLDAVSNMQVGVGYPPPHAPPLPLILRRLPDGCGVPPPPRTPPSPSSGGVRQTSPLMQSWLLGSSERKA